MANILDILRKYSNPFVVTAVAGPYDQRNIPYVERYSEKLLLQLDQVFLAYQQKRLTCPMVMIYGTTGSGKSFLLRTLVEKNQREQKQFFVQIPPARVVESSLETETLASLLWDNLVHCLMRTDLPGFVGFRPVDLYAHRIVREIQAKLKESGESLILGRKFLFFNREFDPGIVEIFNTPRLEKQCLHSVVPEQNSEMLQVLERELRKFVSPEVGFVDMRSWILAETFSTERVACHSLKSDIERLTHFAGMASQLGIPLVFLFDQFEDLNMLPGKNIYNFFLHLFDLVRYQEQIQMQSPLFLTALAEDPQFALTLHIGDRIGILPHARKWIDLKEDTPTLDQSLAEEFTRAYLQQHWNWIKAREANFVIPSPTFPFTNNDLKCLYKHMVKVVGNVTVRQWLSLCHAAWDHVIFDVQLAVPDLSQTSWGKSLEEKATTPGNGKIPGTKIKNDVPLKTFEELVIEFRDKLPSYIEFLGDFFQALIGHHGYPDEGRQIKKANLVNNKKYLEFQLDNDLALATISTKHNQAGGCKKDWEEFVEFAKDRSNGYQYLVFLRNRVYQDFPTNIPEKIKEAKVIKGNLEEKDWGIFYKVLALTKKLPQDQIALLESHINKITEGKTPEQTISDILIELGFYQEILMYIPGAAIK